VFKSKNYSHENTGAEGKHFPEGGGIGGLVVERF
jgi:hypothetical protein